MKLKDGHTYVTRSGIKRIVTRKDYPSIFSFTAKSFCGDGFTENFTKAGRWGFPGMGGKYKKHKWDLVKEFKSNAK